MGSGLARGAALRGKRIAFGKEPVISWSHNAHIIYRNNPNVAPPGSERADDLEWINFQVGHRRYCSMVNGRWQWNTSFRPKPGEIYFDKEEMDWADGLDWPDVIIEPNTKGRHFSNKQWPVARYQAVASMLIASGYRVAQPDWGRDNKLVGVELIPTPNFRLFAALLRRARLYIGPEGGGHHAAAALGVQAVVIFGGFISPQITGYAMHRNIFNPAGSEFGCGNIRSCAHCRQAMLGISHEQVFSEARAALRG